MSSEEEDLPTPPPVSDVDLHEDKKIPVEKSPKKTPPIDPCSDEDDEEEDDPTMYFFNASKYEKEDGNYTGLWNQGATCYLNSLLQTMFMTPEIRKNLYCWRFNEKVHKDKDRSIAYQLQNLFGKMHLIKKKGVSTTKLTKSFGWDRSQSFIQADVNELCRVLFEALDKTLSPNLFKKRELMKKAKTQEERNKISEEYEEKASKEYLISDLFRGEMVDYVLAKDIKDENGRDIGRSKIDHFLDVQLVVRGADSIEKALQNFITPETLDGENQWMCDQLNKKVDAIKGLKFTKFPPLLTLNLKRFDYDPRTWRRVKLGHKVTFPFVLDVSNYLDADEKEKVKCTKYDLYSVLIHSGSIRGGHYYAYIKSFEDGKWYCFNDRNVTEISVEKVEKMFGDDSDANSYSSTNAYMLMYRKQDLEKIEKVDHKLLPAYITKSILQKNAKIEKMLVKAKKQKDMVIVDCLTAVEKKNVLRIRCKKQRTMKDIEDRIYKKIVSKNSDYGKAFPRDCFRIRDWNMYKPGKLFDYEKTLEDYKASIHKVVIIEFKKNGTEWPPDIDMLTFFISGCISHIKPEFSSPTRLLFPSGITLFELKKQYLDNVKRNISEEQLKFMPWFSTDHLYVYEIRIRKEEKDCLIEYTKEDDEKLISKDLGMKEMSLIYMELNKDNTPVCRKVLFDDYFVYDIQHNVPPSDDISSFIRIDKYKTVGDLREMLGKKLNLEKGKFRLVLRRFSRTVLKEEDDDTLLEKTKLYSGIKLFIEVGDKEITDKHHYVQIFLLRSWKEVEEIEKKMEEEKKKKAEEEEEDNDDKSEKEEESEKDEEDDEEEVPDAPKKEEEEETEKKPLTEEEIKLEEEKKERAKIIKELIKEKIYYYQYGSSSYYNNSEKRKAVTKMLVHEDDKLGDFKIKLAEELSKKYGKEIVPNKLRIRKYYPFGEGTIFKENDRTLGDLYFSRVFGEKRLCFELLEEEEELNESKILFRVRKWDPTAWVAGEEKIIIFDKSKKKSHIDFILNELSLLDQKEKYEFQVIKKGVEITNNKIGLIKEWKEISYESLVDDVLIFYREKDAKKKYDPEKLFTGKSYSSSVLSDHGYREKEVALKITTEFDDDNKEEKEEETNKEKNEDEEEGDEKKEE